MYYYLTIILALSYKFILYFKNIADKNNQKPFHFPGNPNFHSLKLRTDAWRGVRIPLLGTHSWMDVNDVNTNVYTDFRGLHIWQDKGAFERPTSSHIQTSDECVHNNPRTTGRCSLTTIGNCIFTNNNLS